MRSMQLQHKLNLALAVVFVSAFSVLGYLFYKTEMQRALKTVEEKAKFVMQTTDASRRYTHKRIFPELKKRLAAGYFVPQAAATFGSRETFDILEEQLRKQGEEQYSFREASLNPMNAEHLADPREAGYIRRFRDDRRLKELTDTRIEPDKKKYLFYIRPITIYEQDCLECHGRQEKVEAAYPGLFKDAKENPLFKDKKENLHYGKIGGFDWQEFQAKEKDRSPVGIAIVKVSMASEMSRVTSRLLTLLLSLLSMFLLVFVVINVMLKKLFLTPVREIAHMTNKLSLGETKSHTFPAARSDEIGSLEQSINRMVVSMRKALDMAENAMTREPAAKE